MFNVLALLAAGILTGYGLRNRSFIRYTGKWIAFTICLLLFLLGVAVGANRQLVENLPDLGFEGVVLALGATGGSVLAAWALYRWLWCERRPS